MVRFAWSSVREIPRGALQVRSVTVRAGAAQRARQSHRGTRAGTALNESPARQSVGSAREVADSSKLQPLPDQIGHAAYGGVRQAIALMIAFNVALGRIAAD